MSSDGISLSFETIFKSLTEHMWVGIVTFIFIMVWTKRDDLINSLKDLQKAKMAAADKNNSELTRINDRYFSLYESSIKNMEKISDAVVTIKEYMIGMEGRIVEKLHEKIDTELSSVKTAIEDDRLEKVFVMVNRNSNPSFNSLEEERQSREIYPVDPVNNSNNSGARNEPRNSGRPLPSGRTSNFENMRNSRTTIRPE